MISWMIKKIDNLIHGIVDKNRFTPKILSREETIDLVLDKRLSIARYGDGEFNIMLSNKDIGFQVQEPELSERLRQIFDAPNPNVLVCIPKVFDWKDRFFMSRHVRHFWSRYLKHQSSKFYELMKTRDLYGDTQLSRPYMDFSKNGYTYGKSKSFFEKIKAIWNQKNVLIVEGELTRFGVGNHLLDNAKEVKRVLCPAKNCWSRSGEIFEKTLSLSKGFDLVILALGPTATVLANDLAAHGVWAFDLGHLDIEYEWFLQRATRKTIVTGKYVNEAKNGDKVQDIVDSEGIYKSQIIDKIGVSLTN